MNNLMTFQTEGVQWLKRNLRCILGDEMGLGKTVQALMLVKECPAIKRVLIVSPASVKGNWKNEAIKWLDVSSDTIQVVSGRKSEIEHKDITIINYDVLPHNLPSLLSREENSMGQRWDLVIFDEAHYLKNLRAKRTVAASFLFSNTPRLVFVTGTPLVNRPADLYVMLRAIDKKWGKQREFEKRFCAARMETLRFGAKRVRRWNNTGASNIEILKNELKEVMLRRKKKDVLTELPEKFHQVIEIEAKDAYGDGLIDTSSENWFEKLPSTPGTAEARRQCGDNKICGAVEHIKNLLVQKDKVIIFAHHKSVVHAIQNKFKSMSVVITGETPTSKRTEIVEKFQKNPKIRLFIGNIVAAGVGITLTAADVVVFVELDWVPGNMLQAEDRAHRIGQRFNVLVQYLVAPGVDAEIGRALAQKIETISKVLGENNG